MKKIFSIILSVFLTFIVLGCSDGGSDTTSTSENNTSLFPINPSLSASESEKMLLVQSETRPIQVQLTSATKLYTSTTSGRPTHHPDDSYDAADIIINDPDSVFLQSSPVYSSGHRVAFIDRKNDTDWWFALSNQNANASKIIWQVSDKPFSIDKTAWQYTPGLLTSGELSIGSKEFTINFSNLSSEKFSLTTNWLIDTLNDTSRLFPVQQIYYVRAFGVDDNNEIVGGLDRGLEILYGDRLNYQPTEISFISLFDLKSAQYQGVLDYKENGNVLLEATEHSYLYGELNLPWYFRPEGFPKETDTIYLQVSKSILETATDSWRDPPGLVHEIKLTRGMDDFDNFEIFNHAVGIDFPSFAQTPGQYYVRAVALSPGDTAGTVNASYSKNVRIICRARGDSEFTYYPPPPPPVTVQAKLPTVKIIEYQPIKWEESDWMYRFEILRQPTLKEYTNGIINSDALIDGLTVGTVIKYERNSDNESWIESAWNAISSFFSSVLDYAAKVADWVSTAYENAKADLISFVAQNIPLPAGYNDKLEDALGYMVDYGLVSVGIPPELPNFDQLSEMGVDYLASTALDMANIPETDRTKQMVEDLAVAVHQSLSDAATSGNPPNPLNWSFVRQDPSAMYRRAYILLEISNPYGGDIYTSSGVLSGKVFRQLTSDELDIGGDSDKIWMNSAYGGSTYFELFRPLSDIQIPRLMPGQTLRIPVYFQEYTGAAFPFHEHVVDLNDFLRMYNSFEYFTFSLNITFDLPAVEAYAASLGQSGAESGYKYQETSRGVSFTADPSAVYTP